MKFVIAALALGLLIAVSFAQDAPLEPEYVNQAYLLKDGKIEKTEIATIKFQTKTTNHFITVKGTSSEVVLGSRSPVRVPPDAHFIVRLPSSDVDPSTLIKLQVFRIGKDDREFLMHTAKAHIYGGVSSTPTDDAGVPITIKKYGAKSLEIIPNAPLAPGEYFFPASGMQADCFGVDVK